MRFIGFLRSISIFFARKSPKDEDSAGANGTQMQSGHVFGTAVSIDDRQRFGHVQAGNRRFAKGENRKAGLARIYAEINFQRSGKTYRYVHFILFNFILNLIFSFLVEKILKQIRKFNWDDAGVSAYAVICLSQPWHVKFSCVQWMASLVAGLMYYYDYVGYQVVDNVLEEFRVGMEINHHKFNQRRLCCAKYLAEMYNYRVVDSPIIFNALYSLITFGVSYDANIPSALDPPEHLFR